MGNRIDEIQSNRATGCVVPKVQPFNLNASRSFQT